MSYLKDEIQELKRELIAMGAHVEGCVKDTYTALHTGSEELLESIIAREEKTNAMEKSLEDHCLRLLVTWNPRAKDFRLICSVLKIITDLERIGDHSQDISEIQMMMAPGTRGGDLPIIESMYEQVTEMLRMGMDAFVAEDEEIAKAVGPMDDIVDGAFLRAREKVIEIIRNHEEDPSAALDLMQIAKYVERIGDHAENIAEWVIYSNTGVHPSLNRELL
ncbi:MAG: phosphate signaling complex protein PhoU [Tissierellia bacterium]|nr:phosphate signaling complex protein PhoU [Tissierellia bacterium]